MTYDDDPVIANVSGYALPRTSWAHVRDGMILGVALTYNHHKPPFEGVPIGKPGEIPLTGDVAVIVTGTHAMAGHLIDRFGNTTPSEGRRAALRAGFPAYHDGADAPPDEIPEDEAAPHSVSEQKGDDHGETHDNAAE